MSPVDFNCQQFQSFQLFSLTERRSKSLVLSVSKYSTASLRSTRGMIAPLASSAASYIHCFLIQTQVFFFKLHAEHGHVVGEFGAGGELLPATYLRRSCIADY